MKRSKKTDKTTLRSEGRGALKKSRTGLILLELLEMSAYAYWELAPPSSQHTVRPRNRKNVHTDIAFCRRSKATSRSSSSTQREFVYK